MATEVITIDRATRDVLQDAVRSHLTPQLEGFNETLRCGSHAEVQEARDLIDRICSLLGDMDWDDESARESYELTVDSSFVPWLREQREDFAVSVESELGNLAHQEGGNADYYGIGLSQQESIAMTQRYIERERHELAIVSALLDRLSLAEAVA